MSELDAQRTDAPAPYFTGQVVECYVMFLSGSLEPFENPEHIVRGTYQGETDPEHGDVRCIVDVGGEHPIEVLTDCIRPWVPFYPPAEEQLLAGKILRATCAQIGAPLATYAFAGDGKYQVREYPMAGYGCDQNTRGRTVAEGLTIDGLRDFCKGLRDWYVVSRETNEDYEKGYQVGQDLLGADRLYPKGEGGEDG